MPKFQFRGSRRPKKSRKNEADEEKGRARVSRRKGKTEEEEKEGGEMKKKEEENKENEEKEK